MNVLWKRHLMVMDPDEKKSDPDLILTAPLDDEWHDVYLIWVDHGTQTFRYRQLEHGAQYVVKKEQVFSKIVPVNRYIPAFCRFPLLYYQALPKV